MAVEGLAGGAGQDRGRRRMRARPSRSRPTSAESASAATPSRREVAGPVGQPVPGRVAGDRAQERFRGAGAPPLVESRGVSAASVAKSPGPLVGGRTVRRLPGDQGRDAVRGAGRELQRHDAAEAHAEDGDRADPPRVEVGDEVVDVDVDVERAGSASRDVPMPDGRWRGPRRLGRGESVARRPSWAAWDSVPGSRRIDGGPCRSTRQPMASPPGRARIPAGRRRRGRGRPRAELAAGGPRHGVEADERGRHLDAGERAAAGAEIASSPGSATSRRRTIAATGTWPRSGSRRATTAASSIAGCSASDASTSAGEMFSPPRTIGRSGGRPR